MAWWEVRELLDLTDYANINLRERFKVVPGEHEGALVALKREGQTTADRFRWGFQLRAEDKRRPVNAIGETLFTKWPWKVVAKRNRLLIPMDLFYEPLGPPVKRGDPPRRQFVFQRPERHPFLVAGVWAKPVADETPHTFALVTTNPNDTVGSVHGRMPAIIDLDNADQWLSDTDDTSALQELLVPWSGELECWEVDNAKLNARGAEGAELIEPVAQQQDDPQGSLSL